jgi:hypothetical protein
MWIFTRYGFYSVACASKPDGSIDHATVMVRARCISHLEQLQRRLAELSGAEIVTFTKRDYRYRIIVPESVWATILVQLAGEQTWSNFKDEAARFQGAEGAKYVRALHEVWRVMYGLQPTET